MHGVRLVQTTHQDALNSLQTELDQAKAAQEGLREQLAAHDATIQQQTQQLEELNGQLTELQTQLSKPLAEEHVHT